MSANTQRPLATQTLGILKAIHTMSLETVGTPILIGSYQRNNNHIPKRGHIPEAVVIEVLEDLNNNRTYRQIKEDYAVSIGWIHKIKHNKIRK